jgi:hypothetical protein
VADTSTYYGIDQFENIVYKVTLQWDVDEAGVREERPDVIVEPIGEFRTKDSAQAVVRAWNHPQI